MNIRSYRTFQGLVVAVLGVFLFSLVYSGNILLYINRRFVLLSFLAAILLIILSQVIMRERPAPDQDRDEAAGHETHLHTERRSSWSLWWLALPVLVGVLIPARPLGSFTAGQRGINLSASLTTSRAALSSALGIPTQERSVLDWIRVVDGSGDPQKYAGQTVDVTGFVYHDPRLPNGQFMVGRFAVTCCVADALAIGMPVQWSSPVALADNVWVRIRGAVQIEHIDGHMLPGIQATVVDIIPAPDQPYLFP